MDQVLVLVHYGIPGMKWGRRKGSAKSSKPSIASMSDKDLQSAVNRMRLETAYTKGMTKKSPFSKNVKKGAAFTVGIALAPVAATYKKQATRAINALIVGAVKTYQQTHG